MTRDSHRARAISIPIVVAVRARRGRGTDRKSRSRSCLIGLGPDQLYSCHSAAELP